SASARGASRRRTTALGAARRGEHLATSATKRRTATETKAMTRLPPVRQGRAAPSNTAAPHWGTVPGGASLTRPSRVASVPRRRTQHTIVSGGGVPGPGVLLAT